MIFFGDPESEGVAEDAYKCVMMAVEMQNRMESFREEQREAGVLLPFHIRCGIATGSVSVGNFGSHDRMDYTIIGRYVSLAKEMEASAPIDGVLISEETYLYVKDRIKATAYKKITMREFAHDIQPYIVKRTKTPDELSAAANITLEAVLNNIDRARILLDFDTKKLVSEIRGIYEEEASK
jgi:class 3 adenylate cyclase